MPKEITEFKKFIELTQGKKASKDGKSKTETTKKRIIIKKNSRVTKFKVRRGKHLFTFKTDKLDMVKRIEDSLDKNQVEKVLIKNRSAPSKPQKK